MACFYRYQEGGEFTSLTLDRKTETSFSGAIPADTSGGLSLEYYFAAKAGESIVYLPAQTPEEVFKIPGKTGEALPAAKPEIPAAEAPPAAPFPLSFTSSLQYELSKSTGSSTEPFTHFESVSLAYQYCKDRLSLDLNARATFTGNPPTGSSKSDLPGLALSLKTRAHALSAGDLSLNESEFSATGIGRRGLEYRFDDGRFYVHAFMANSQQLSGFKGIGVPPSANALYGGVAGFSLFQGGLNLKAIFITGKDDPFKAGNGGFWPLAAPRQGNVLAVAEESSLFSGRFRLNAEFASSRYDKDTQDAEGAISDSAWRISAGYRTDKFEIGGGYRRLGPDFNSIAQPFFTADRAGMNASAALTLESFRLSARFANERNNVGDDPNVSTSRNTTGGADLGISIGRSADLQVGYDRTWQKAGPDQFFLGNEELLKSGLRGSLVINPSPSTGLTFSAQLENVTCKQAPEKDGRSFGLNFGASFRAGERFTFNPALSYNLYDNVSTGEKTHSQGVFASGNLYLVPAFVSLSFTGSYNRAALPGGDVTQTTAFEGGLNLERRGLGGFATIILSIGGSFVKNVGGGVSSPADTRIFVKADIALN
ncbi:MAG: hypothetical protein WCB96_14160 [Candidatus Aminicenantales bacterium]